MSLIKKLAGETLIYGAGSVLPKVLNFVILTPYLTYKFNDELGLYGIHGIMYSFVGLLMVLLTLRLETTFFRFGSKKDTMDISYSTGLSVLLIMSALCIAILFMFSVPIASLWTKAADAHYVKIISFILGLDIIAALPFARLRLESKPKRFSFIKIMNVVITIVVLLFFLEALPMLSANGIEWAQDLYQKEHRLTYVFLSNLVGSLAVVLLLLPELKKYTWSFDGALFRKMFSYAWPLIIVGIAGVINVSSDRWLLNNLLPGSEEDNEKWTGIYNACAKIAIFMSLFTTAFNYAAEPFFFKQAGNEKSPQLYADIARAFTLLASFIFLIILFYLDLFQHLIGSNFREGLYVVPVLLLAYLFLGLHYNFSVWYKVNDKTKIGAMIAIVGSVISLSVNIILIPKIGPMAAAWAAFFTFLVMAILNVLIGKMYYPIPYKLGKIILIIALAYGFYLLSSKLDKFIVLQMDDRLMVNSVLLIIYAAIMYFLEKDFYKRILSSS